MEHWQTVKLDLAKQKGLWFLWPARCPMMEAKLAAARDEADRAPMACMGGHINVDAKLSIFTTCWHTTSKSARVGESGFGFGVLCRYDPARDGWNHPGKHVGAPPPPPWEMPADGTEDHFKPTDVMGAK